MLIRIPVNFLKDINVGCERIPTLYFHSNKIARDFFWKRLGIAHDLILEFVQEKGKCMDFGCGNGVFLPSLASLFTRVAGVDIETREAEKIVDFYNLKEKVEIFNLDLTQEEFKEEEFDLVTTLDVLEHFENLETPVSQIKKCLKKNGLLVTSLPTENFFTRLTRKISGSSKPFDHYHKGKAVEEYLAKGGFVKIKGVVLSIFFPLYHISIWKKI